MSKRYIKLSSVEWEQGYTLFYEGENEGRKIHSVMEYRKDAIEEMGYCPFIEYADRFLRMGQTYIEEMRKDGSLWKDIFFKGDLPEVTREEFKEEDCGHGLGKHVKTVSKYISETGIVDLFVFQKCDK